MTYKYTVESPLLVYLQNATVCGHRIILISCIYPPQLKGWSVKVLSDIKLVCGIKEVGNSNLALN